MENTESKPKRNWKNMTPEELKEVRRYYNSLRKNRQRKEVPIQHCDICNCDIKWDNMGKHRRTIKHQNNIIKSTENNQLDKDVE